MSEIVCTNSLPMRLLDNGEVRIVNMFQLGDKIYVSKEIFDELKKRGMVR